ncbi:hypothetical protein J6590_019428 [Homalodisca vitripennis]|nr:hypothetical protein J6590_019428 [Homalodisca vitripennis]
MISTLTGTSHFTVTGTVPFNNYYSRDIPTPLNPLSLFATKSGAQHRQYILAVPNLSESPRLPHAVNLSLDEIEKVKSTTSAIFTARLVRVTEASHHAVNLVDEIGGKSRAQHQHILPCHTYRVTEASHHAVNLRKSRAQHHNILAVPHLSESPRLPTTPSISLDEIGESQVHNISNILAVPDLSGSPRLPTTPSISLDEIGESQEHNISNILAVPDLSESPRPLTTPSGPSERSEDIVSKPGL